MQKSLFENGATAEPMSNPKTYTGIYAMHKYWSKKPADVVAHFIERYSNPGDVVLDCFSGSGISLIEALRLERRAIGVDVNPAAVFMTNAALLPVDIASLRRTFAAIKSDSQPVIDSLYITSCEHCGSQTATASHLIWASGIATELWYQCETCKIKKGIKTPSPVDEKLAIEPTLAAQWYPRDELHINARINVKAGARICDLFTVRALTALSIIFQRLQQIPDDNERLVLLSCFTATLPQASRMVFVIRRRGKKADATSLGRAEIGSWVIGFWVPKEHFEINAWRCFENRFTRTLRGKKDLQSLIKRDLVVGNDVDAVLNEQADYCAAVGNAAALEIPESSIDYAFIDPPHGNRIPYLELSMIWNSWLGEPGDWENEIIVSDAKGRSKNIADYNSRMRQVLNELHRVLKQRAYVSIAFNSLNDDTWVSFVSAILDANFEIAGVEPMAYSANSVVQDNRDNALHTDFVLNCRKIPACLSRPLKIIDTEHKIREAIETALKEHEGHARTYQVLNVVLKKLLPQGVLICPSAILEMLTADYGKQGDYWLYRKAQ